MPVIRSAAAAPYLYAGNIREAEHLVSEAFRLGAFQIERAVKLRVG